MRYDDEEVLERLKRSGALRSGHFELSSGLHSGNYIQCAKALVSPDDVAYFAGGVIELLPEAGHVVSPAIGGIVIGHKVADVLRVPFVFAERNRRDEMAFRRGLSVPDGAIAAVVEDVVTTGGSVGEVVGLLEAGGASVVKIVSMVKRNDLREIAGVPLDSLIFLDLEQYEPADCPLCGSGVPLERPGSGK